MKSKKKKYSQIDIEKMSQQEPKNTGGVVIHNGVAYYKKPFDKIMAIVKREKERQ